MVTNTRLYFTWISILNLILKSSLKSDTKRASIAIFVGVRRKLVQFLKFLIQISHPLSL